MKVLTSYVVYSKFRVDRKNEAVCETGCSQVTNTSAGGHNLSQKVLDLSNLFFHDHVHNVSIKPTT